MTRRAFTLVELLVVIAIMVTLMSLIMGGVMLAKRSAMRAKAVSLLGAVASAIDQYRSLNNVYPELIPVNTTTGTLFGVAPPGEVYSNYFGPSTAIKAAQAVQSSPSGAEWENINRALVYQLESLISDQVKNGQLIDPWKKPLRYRPSKWYPYTPSTPPTPIARIDSENPPGADSYQLWSAGPDATDFTADPGEGGDDIPQWAKSQ